MKRSRLDALVMEQEKLNSLTRADIESVQLGKLNSLLAKEKERAGFYAKLPEKLESLHQLQELPFTTAEDLFTKAPSMLLCSQADIQRILTDVTSGTSGREKRVFYTMEDCENTVKLFMTGLGELVFPGSRTMICMPFSGPYGLGELIAEAVRRLGAEPLKAGVALSYAEMEEILANKKPDSYVGMPVQLLSMLRVCGKHELKHALVSADACPDKLIEKCEEILGSRLFPHYGSREMGLGGAVCCQAHEGMHIRENHVICEIIDEHGRPQTPGVYGELVITTVGMEAMPLIRYRTGDKARVLPIPCPCGSELLRLDSVSRFEQENQMAYYDSLIFEHDEIADYSVEKINGIYNIRVLTAGEYNLREVFTSVFGENITVDIRTVNMDDHPLYMGKRRIFEK